MPRDPTPEQLAELASLELAIYEAGIDGGILTSDAIDALHAFEKSIGVYNPDAETPRWINTS